MAIWRKCLEHSVLSQKTFFKATCTSCFRLYPSAEIPGHEVFSHPSLALKHDFWKVLKFFLRSVNERQIITQKIEKHDDKNVFL